MTVTKRERAVIVTPTTMYRGHIFEVHEFADGTMVKVCSRAGADILDDAGEPLQLAAASLETRDGRLFRVTGQDRSGAEVVWRVVGRQCACVAESVVPTPVWDIPI